MTSVCARAIISVCLSVRTIKNQNGWKCNHQTWRRDSQSRYVAHKWILGEKVKGQGYRVNFAKVIEWPAWVMEWSLSSVHPVVIVWICCVVWRCEHWERHLWRTVGVQSVAVHLLRGFRSSAHRRSADSGAVHHRSSTSTSCFRQRWRWRRSPHHREDPPRRRVRRPSALTPHPPSSFYPGHHADRPLAGNRRHAGTRHARPERKPLRVHFWKRRAYAWLVLVRYIGLDCSRFWIDQNMFGLINSYLSK